MIRYSHTSYLKTNVSVRHYVSNNIADALVFAEKFGGVTERIHNGTKHVWKIMI